MKPIAYLIIAALLANSAVAMPVLPTGYYGYVKDSAGNPFVDVIVNVKDANGRLVGRSAPTNADGLYSLNVLWDDADTQEDEGVVSGEEISFFIDDRRMSRLTVGEQGSNNYLDLVYSSSASHSGATLSTIVTGQEAETTNETEESTNETKTNQVTSIKPKIGLEATKAETNNNPDLTKETNTEPKPEKSKIPFGKYAFYFIIGILIGAMIIHFKKR